MRKSFLTKAFVAVGVMASAMALSAIGVFAADTVVTWNLSDIGNYYLGTSQASTPLQKGNTYTIKSGNYSLTYCVQSSNSGNADTVSNTDGLKQSGGAKCWNQRYFTVDVPASASISVNAKAQGSYTSPVIYSVNEGNNVIGTVNTSASEAKDINVYTNDTNSSVSLRFLFDDTGSNGSKKQYIYNVKMTIPDQTNPAISGLASTAEYNLSDSSITLSASMNSVAENAGYSILWASSNENKAKVENGVVTAQSGAVAGDKVNITASVVDPDNNNAIVEVNGTPLTMTCEVTFINTYTVTGTYTPTDASLTASKGTLTTSNGSFSLVLEQGEDAVITATKKTYYTYVTDTLNANSSNVVISMTALNATAGDSATRLDISNFNAPSANNLPASDEVLDTNNANITAGDFSISSGKIKIYTDAEKVLTLVPQSGVKIKYTPSTDGVIKINAARNGGDANKRGFTIAGGDLNQTWIDSASNLKTLQLNSYNVVADQEYTITINDGAVLLDYIEFVAGAHVPEFVGTVPTADTNDSLGIIKGDGEYYVYALVSGTKLNDYSKVTISNGTNSVNVKEVYQTVTFNGGNLTVQDTNNYMAIAYLGDGVTDTPDISGYTATFVGSNEE